MPGYIRRKTENKLTFIDLFAGIGGIRLGFERAGAECIFSSEWDKFAQQTYEANFGEEPKGDIRKLDATSIPDFNILCAGFPCQPFSIAGVSKKNSLNRPHGFADMTQGTLFYEIIRILEVKKPDAFFLENVKNLESHDKGRTFAIIRSALEDIGYSFFYKVINANNILPQNRARIFMVGFRDKNIGFTFPEITNRKPRLMDILDPNPDEKYTLSDHLWEYLQDYAEKHRRKGNGFGFGLTDLNSYSRTLSARYYKDGSEILIPQKGMNPRRLTPRECARLQGYPESFIIPVSDTQAYKQFGNSVAVPLVEVLARQVVFTLQKRPRGIPLPA
ncbi:DNA (cytosine-5-)-methyltransferase [Methanocalculus sp.]|uniref:DNA (cytosine-5-)-methyltransferase n=1 Tax=Methanocalculus sp. TaxID=2004547 RepID=UPI00262C42C4|nr:DNA (cytosine-5-)-methyltransferase [Methanocalculus sp.]MDG6250409.1 DNA (cytosine-5-)-methyltransferase [Methanocalculus sp.]